MGVEEFMSEDGTLVTRFDNFMIRQVAEIGYVYQSLTGRSYKRLANSLFEGGRKGAMISIAPMNIPGIAVLHACNVAVQNKAFETPVEEEIRLEKILGNKYAGKHRRVYRVKSFIFLSLLSRLLVKIRSS
jgi:hypothetical protein